MRTCSACAGDYEDPDLTVWEPDDEEPEEFSDGNQGAGSPTLPQER